ncbi:glycosyl transferase [Billgrantia tianxiuensis]|jgi:predicted LPLAT superfamily acyltransferase|uniref:Glycosyl transferase n=1 Tax=Billgrantia tianxiuensis TaxID=2497861 RepID=A0A6I6SMW9_9GAMM|nr:MULTISPECIES: glycosyl transferase [Halomonas]MCE8034134.1 glycosyl transferase [Halomonas sp. MCCC 1A11057]QHC51032.1 glycosyl transferase [Halomonas tianxiuensis]
MNRHWARIGERGTLAGMTLMVAIQRHLGRWPFRLVLAPVMLWYFLAHATARRASQSYLQRLYPALERRPLARWWHSYRHFLTFGDALMDKVAAWSGDIADGRLTGPGIERFTAAIDGGRGGLILVAHHGNLDVANALAERHPGLELTVLMHTRNARKFNALLERVTGRPRPHVLEVSAITPATAQALAERIHTGGYVVIAADRLSLSGGRTQCLDFFGDRAMFPEGPFWLAALLRCPLYTLACVREDGSFRIDFEAIDDTGNLPRRQREAWISEAMQRHADHLAERVRQHPLQWFNFYPFWMNDTGFHHDDTA